MKILFGILGVIGLFVVISIVSIIIQNQKPQVELGVKKGKFADLPNKPNCVSTQTSDQTKFVEPLAFKNSLSESKTAIVKALKEFGAIEIQKETADYIYAVATTATLKFHDDIEVYFDETSKLVHYRSASRAGYGDMGVNRDRYNKIAELYAKN